MSGRAGINPRTGLPSQPEGLTQALAIREPFDFVQAADIFAGKGITHETAAELGLTHDEFTAWAMTQDGHDEIQKAHLRLSSKLDARLSFLIDKVSADLETRLIQGNKIFNRKTGEFDFVPIEGRDLAVILGVLFDRRQLLRKQPTKITEKDQKLEELTDKLRQIGGPRDDNKPEKLGVERAARKTHEGR